MRAGFEYRLIRAVGREGVEAFKRRWELGHSGLQIGLPEGAHEPDGTPLALIGAVHEFGSSDGRIPERSWLRGGLRQQRHDIVRLNKVNLARIGKGQIGVHAALGQLGNMVVGGIKKYIRSRPFEPLAESTIEARNRKLGAGKGENATPLIDTGNMIQSITYEIVER